MKSMVGLSLALCVSAPFAATCEQNFRTEGDPRNGAEYFASSLLPELTVADAIAQLRGIAAGDGFNVLSDELSPSQGKLTIEQAKGSRPFLIHLSAAQKGRAADVAVQTRLNRGATARDEDMRNAMCGMLGRVKTGEPGVQAAAKVRAAQGPAGTGDTTPKALADELFKLSKSVEPEVISARYKGRRYRLDGQIQEPLENEGTIELWYRVQQEDSALLGAVNNKSYLWPSIVCRLAKSDVGKAQRLRTGDWAKLTGTVSHYQPGTPNRLVLTECRFE